MSISFDDVRKNPEIKTYIQQADASLLALGYTEHSFAHVTHCALQASEVLQKLGYSEHEQELVKIAAYLHDIGNMVNRYSHALSGSLIAFQLLSKMGMPPEDLAAVTTAIGHHDEPTAFPVNAITAALLLADKTDVRRSRVRNQATITFDIHDRVNFAVEEADFDLDTETQRMTLLLTINTEVCPVVEYFEIFLDRMLLCRKAADFFGYTFKLVINGSELM